MSPEDKIKVARWLKQKAEELFRMHGHKPGVAEKTRGLVQYAEAIEEEVRNGSPVE